MTRLLPLCAAIPLLAFNIVAHAQGINPEHLNLITFDNRSEQSIEYLYVSPGDSNFWSTDILGATRVLGAGDTLVFYIHYPNECDAFDFMGIDSRGNAAIKFNYRICDETAVVVPIASEDLSHEAPDMDLAEVTIVNQLSFEIHYLFFSPSDSAMWGVSQLDKETILYPGDAITLLLPVEDYLVSYDIQAVDEDQDSYTFSVQLDNSSESYVVGVEPSDID